MFRRHPRKMAAMAMGVALIVATLPALADDYDDHDRALGAVERGEALSLAEVMTRAKQQLRGEVVGTRVQPRAWSLDLRIQGHHAWGQAAPRLHRRRVGQARQGRG